MVVSTNISKILMDVTGEPRPQLAIINLLKDAIEYRIEKIETEIKQYEKKYHQSFDEYKRNLDTVKLFNSDSYITETDYLDWEGLLSRRSRYLSILNNLM